MPHATLSYWRGRSFTTMVTAPDPLAFTLGPLAVTLAPGALVVTGAPVAPAFTIGGVAIPVTARPLSVAVAPPFVPTDIANLALWVKADSAQLYTDAAQTIPAGDGDGVYWWLDQSGMALSFTQATGAARPTFKTSVVNGNKPAVRFDNVDDTMALVGGGALFQNRAGATVFVVAASVTVPATTHYVFFASITSNPGVPRVLLFRTPATYSVAGRRLDADAFQSTSAAPAASAGVFTVDTAVFDWANAVLRNYKNGTASGTMTPFQTTGASENGASAEIRLGTAAGVTGDCDIAELLVYQRVLTTTERNQVHSYLGTKYGITVV